MQGDTANDDGSGRGEKPSTGRGPEPQEPPQRRRYSIGLWVVLALLAGLILLVQQDAFSGKALPYSQFKKALAAGEIAECKVGEDVITGRLVPKTKDAVGVEPKPSAFRTVRIEDKDLVRQLQEAGIDYEGVASSRISPWLLLWLVPLALIFLLPMLLMRRAGTPGSSMLAFGRSKAKVVANLDTGVTFDDVAGCEEAKQDLREVVEFLAAPERFVRLGAKIPKGLILFGAPGTGKTLLARAVAGEARVPFFSISGSDFVEMFVGVGAARVRDLFEQALKQAPCIVFIDEIDAVGRTRAVHMTTASDEREQTLNQLLVEMDGFEPNNGVILLAATNRPDVLDRALLRPGRFDRQVVLDVPDMHGRLAILAVHARGKPLAPEVDLAKVAKATPGLAGADLANLLNEAALLAARRGVKEIGAEDLNAALERVLAGPERRSRRMLDPEKRRVAYHETGHALVAHFTHGDPVQKISIVPRGRAALGFTMQLPEERVLLTRSELRDKLAGLLAGRAAEELTFGDISTGAADDLERATALVRQMICLWGMGDSAGLMKCARDLDPRMAQGADALQQRDCSEATAREIDAEVKATLGECYEHAKTLLSTHRQQLDRIAAVLIEQETLTGDAFAELLRSAPAESPPPPTGDEEPAAPSRGSRAGG